MDFAKKLLNKYGWKEGDGLGKDNSGITKPLKASLKFDGAGFGADQAASDFNNHWWERVFNEAAQNVKVHSDAKNGNVKLDLKDADNGVEISTKGYSVKKLKKLNAQKEQSGAAYNNFMKTATLTNSGAVVDNPFKVVEEDIAVTPFKTLTDEELFAACGGRTAHKGARHGLKLSGKLARIAKQEQEILAKMEAQQNEKKQMETFEETEKKPKKKKKDKNIECEEIQEPNETIEEVENVVSNKRKKKKKYKTLDCEQVEEIEETVSKKCKKSKKRSEEQFEPLEEPQKKRSKKSKTKNKEESS